MFNQDYEDLFSTLNARRIKYLVVGAHAVTFYTEPRFTKDLDVWIPPALNDPRRVYRALRAFAPLTGLVPEDFSDSRLIVQIGIAPVRIDIMMDVLGVSAIQAWRYRRKTRYGKVSIYVIGLADLIKAKKASGRSIDKLDLAKLLRRSKEK